MQTCDQTRRSRPAEPVPLPRHKAIDLTKGGELAQIELDGQVYTLRITRQGKLILTK
ncbi:MAG: hemin uptake protein HemP [Pseudomonadota bacterium]